MVEIGTREHPLRASSLGVLMTCPLRAVLEQRPAGEAADTGSLVHAGVAEWHRTKDATGALRTLREAVRQHPLGNTSDAVKHFQAYIQDPANQEAEVVKIEEEVELTLEGSTGPIYLVGHLDQIRSINGVWKVFDIKTGRPKGWEMMQVALYQIAAYSYAATVKFGRPVHPGAIIRTRGYLERGDADHSVFFNYTLTSDHAKALISRVPAVVDAIRRGEAWPVPGPYCYQCQANGFDVCVPNSLEVISRGDESGKPASTKKRVRSTARSAK